MKEASTELQPSTLPEAWERSSLSDDGIREALRARSKHYAALDEVDQADSATMSPERSALGVSPSICTKHPVCYLHRHRDRPILFSSTLHPAKMGSMQAPDGASSAAQEPAYLASV